MEPGAPICRSRKRSARGAQLRPRAPLAGTRKRLLTTEDPDPPLIFPPSRQPLDALLGLFTVSAPFGLLARPALGRRAADRVLSEADADVAEARALVPRRMGTSVKMIDRTYGHLVADEYERELLDRFDSGRSKADGHAMGTEDQAHAA